MLGRIFKNLKRHIDAINPLAEPLKAKAPGQNTPAFMRPEGIHGGKEVKATKAYADGRQKNPRLRRLSGLTVGSHFVAPKPSKHALMRQSQKG